MAVAPKRGLGRGLGALIPDARPSAESSRSVTPDDPVSAAIAPNTRSG